MTADTTPGVAVVTGGSRGLGRRLVERLLDEGWRVATFSRSANEFTAACAAAHENGFRWHKVDLADPGAVRGFMSAVVDTFGRVDLLVNNAATLHEGLLLTTPMVKITEVVAHDLVGPIVLTQACAKAMSRRGSGVIVNVSSINSIRGFRGVSVYAAAKAGLDGFGRSIARELASSGIRVNSVVPGFFDTDLTSSVPGPTRERIERRTPLGRVATVDEVANVVLFLASRQAEFITGQTIVVDGGITC